LLALQEVFDVRDDNVFKAASGLHGGIGGTHDVCGSLLGASMMLGLMCGGGPEEADTLEKNDKSTGLVSQLYKWFKKEFGSVKCRNVCARFEKEINNEISAPGQAELSMEDRLHAKCDVLASKTSAKAAEILGDNI
jgi:C_GCAxxG_C_C family probable redox protein